MRVLAALILLLSGAAAISGTSVGDDAREHMTAMVASVSETAEAPQRAAMTAQSKAILLSTGGDVEAATLHVLDPLTGEINELPVPVP